MRCLILYSNHSSFMEPVPKSSLPCTLLMIRLYYVKRCINTQKKQKQLFLCHFPSAFLNSFPVVYDHRPGPLPICYIYSDYLCFCRMVFWLNWVIAISFKLVIILSLSVTLKKKKKDFLQFSYLDFWWFIHIYGYVIIICSMATQS